MTLYSAAEKRDLGATPMAWKLLYSLQLDLLFKNEM